MITRKMMPFLLLLLVACQETRTPFTLDAHLPPDSIVGGLEVDEKDGDSKLVVLVRGEKDIGWGRKRFVFCTGSFISSNIVVTAAHCFKDEGYSFKVVYQTQNSSKLSRQEFSEIKNIIVHENYRNGFLNKDGYRDDIALVEIIGQKPDSYQVLQLLPDFDSYGPFQFLAIGYGQTLGDEKNANHGSTAGVLRKTALKAFNLNPFRSTFMVDQSSGSGVCLGDSGGPAIIRDQSKNFVVGIVQSVFVDEARINRGDLGVQGQDICQGRSYFMNLVYYNGWLEKHLNILSHKNMKSVH